MTERGTEGNVDRTQEPSPHELSAQSERGPLPSSAEDRLREIRRELVIQLYSRRGPLWEAVRDVRERRKIKPKRQLPPPVRVWLLPEDAPEREDDSQKYAEYAFQWREEMSSIRAKLDLGPSLPTQDLPDYHQEESWKEFRSACVLYDPPEDQLIEFASYGKLKSTALYSDPFWARSRRSSEMLAPPVKSLWELTLLRDWYWHRILRFIGERYLEAWDVDVEYVLEHPGSWEPAMTDPDWAIPGLDEEIEEKYEQYSKRYYIEVDESTSGDDFKSALPDDPFDSTTYGN